jgi:hypothetical protein
MVTTTCFNSFIGVPSLRLSPNSSRRRNAKSVTCPSVSKIPKAPACRLHSTTRACYVKVIIAPNLAFDVLRQVACSGGVLDQNHLAGADHPALTVAGGYLHPGVEIDDVLPTRGRVPVDVVLGLRLTKNDTVAGRRLESLLPRRSSTPLHFNVAEMRLAARIGI